MFHGFPDFIGSFPADRGAFPARMLRAAAGEFPINRQINPELVSKQAYTMLLNLDHFNAAGGTVLTLINNTV